jgi:hypothetical protein
METPHSGGDGKITYLLATPGLSGTGRAQP